MAMRPPPTTLEVLVKAFKAHKNNAAALAAVLKVHPHSRMTLATVNWYRNRYRKDDAKIPTEHSLR